VSRKSIDSLEGERVQDLRAKWFRRRHFPEEIIVLCLRWHLRYCLSYRDLEEMMARARSGC
jgi:hypothetical protein